MAESNFIVATAGHVDHGKSALVRRLTGIDPDRLPEEKARGITIDLGFAHLTLSDPADPQRLFQVGLVDVPGHEDFIKNMVAGIGSVDAALFVVAADDGWMPQSEEHLQILSYLGVTRAVVALTKIDLVEDSSGIVSAIRQKLHDSPWATSAIVPVSVHADRGIEELTHALADLLATAPPPADIGKPRVHVDRSFSLPGIGTVVTGTLIGGTLSKNETVVIQPRGDVARIRNLQRHNRDVESCEPGTRVALNLPDVAAGEQTAGTRCVQRGDVITRAGQGTSSDTLEVLIQRSARFIMGANNSAMTLKPASTVRVHHGSRALGATLLLRQAGELRAGGQALGQLRLDEPIYALAGDRFVVRDASGLGTIAGGLILDADADRREFRASRRGEILAARAARPDDPAVFVRTEIEQKGFVPRSQLLVKTRFSEHDIAGALARLAGENAVVIKPEFAVLAQSWRSARLVAEEAIDGFHRHHPQKAGFAVSDLRSILSKSGVDALVAGRLLEELCDTGFRAIGALIARREHAPALPHRLAAKTEEVRRILHTKPFEPPPEKELGADAASREALRFLIESGEVIEVSDDLAMLQLAFTAAAETIRQFLQERGSATVSELRQAVGTNRRVIVPLLERLDQTGVTLRIGDKRVLKKPV